MRTCPCSALRPVPRPREQRHQPSAILLGEQALPQVRRPRLQVPQEPGRRVGQEERLPVPGVPDDRSGQPQVFLTGVEEISAQEGHEGQVERGHHPQLIQGVTDHTSVLLFHPENRIAS
ncbi:hypothetical protein CEXT_359261 [Caerostris extrusa]|uniref:Uncharacterized protein n=1 Tax=Caerostris extrusa TaxID=172846 RepID=A0AAV4NYR6_CAEEX|nr:hypothetical protein CEXT_359261 [Caerostris extrusa]